MLDELFIIMSYNIAVIVYLFNRVETVAIYQYCHFFQFINKALISN